MPILKKLLEYTGIDARRLSVDWVSAAEGEKFATIVRDFTETIRAMPSFVETMKGREQGGSKGQGGKEAAWTSA